MPHRIPSHLRRFVQRRVPHRRTVAVLLILLSSLVLDGSLFGQRFGRGFMAIAADPQQGTLRVRVIDRTNGAALPGSLVLFNGPATRAGQTDAAGLISVSLPVGMYTVTASRSGYRTSEEHATIRAAQLRQLKISLLAVSSSPPPPSPSPSPPPSASPPPSPPPVPTPEHGARWSDPAAWAYGRVPTRTDDVVIAAGTTIEVDTLSAEARSVTVEGTLRAGRNMPSRLVLYGNLIVKDRGVLDYGRPDDRVLVPASISWFLNESQYVGGMTMEPLATDVGLWAIDDAQVWIHGVYRDTWSPLMAPAGAGSIEISVDPTYAAGWAIGDTLVIGPSHLKETATDNQDEIRRISQILGPGRIKLDAPLQWHHDSLVVTWTDAWGDAWNERLAAKVANLTSNIVFAAGDANHRPHSIFMNRAKHYVEDLAVVNFSPLATRDPMGRYAWHNHLQYDGSRGSYLRRTRIYGGPGEGYHIHHSSGVQVEDIVIYNQARSLVERSGTITNTNALVLERDNKAGSDTRAADDCWIERPLVMRWGVQTRDYRNAGIWLTRSLRCAVMGAVATGGGGQSRSSGIHWDEGGGNYDNPYVLRAEAHSNRVMGLHAWQNATPTQPIVDVLVWRNGDTGIGWGAYGTHYWGFQMRSLGNRVAQFAHWATGWGVTGFLADGMGVGSVGIEVRKYTANSVTDGVYEAGVVRNLTDSNVRHIPTAGGPGGKSWVQFAHVVWDPGRGLQFGGPDVPPPGSLLRFRLQTNLLSYPANFTLYHPQDPNAPAGAIPDPISGALRLDGDNQGTRPRPPRVKITTPDETVAQGSIRIDVETNAQQVEFYQGPRLLGSVPVVGGHASIEFDMSRHPYRRAYFWAVGRSANGAVNTSRVIRIRRF